MRILYGIANCDTVKKARRWLEGQGFEYLFHYYRQDGMSLELLISLEGALGWEAMLNRKSTTWRSLDDTDRQNLNRDKAIALMLAHPALIKRPILITDDKTLIGFDAEQYRSIA